LRIRNKTHSTRPPSLTRSPSGTCLHVKIWLKASHGRATDDEVLQRLGPLLDQLGDFSKVRIKVERENRHPAIDQEEINQADPTSEACDQPDMSVSQ
jgi:hypothetical protein